MDWCTEEFSGIDFGDKRLHKRFVKVAQSMLDNPLRSISEAGCGVWSDVKAAYRLFANNKISSEKFLDFHAQKTISRCVDLPTVLAIQDSSGLSYARFPSISDMGTVEGKNTWSHKGLILHPTLAVTPTGECLGLLDLQAYSRADGVRREHHYAHIKIPIHQKESFRWIKSFQNAEARSNNRIRLITIADREADIYELFDEAEKLGSAFLIRACKDRRVLNFDDESDNSRSKIGIELAKTASCGRYLLEIKGVKERQARKAELTVKFTSMTIDPPIRRGAANISRLSPLEVYVICAHEENPPKGVKGLSWVLLTNTPVKNKSEAIEKIGWYKTRWVIETFFMTVKSGFKIESTRLNRQIKMERFVTLTCILATRVMRLKYLSRAPSLEPNHSIKREFSETEIKILQLIAIKQKKFAKEEFNIKIAVRILAALGGFLGRKGDGHPGVTTVWRGLQKLHDLEHNYSIFEEFVGKT